MEELARILSGGLATMDQWVGFTDGWLANRRLSPHTRDSYRRDVRTWLEWCERRRLEPLAATFVHVNAFAREMEAAGSAPATVGRTLSGISSWYLFLIKVGATKENPVVGADRPHVSRDESPTVGLTPEECDCLLAAAEVSGSLSARNVALVTLLIDDGLRIHEALQLDVDSIGVDQGRPVVRFLGKRGARRKRVLTPEGERAIAHYLNDRDSGPLFLSSHGKRLDRTNAWRMIKQLAAAAALPEADLISPHSLRHAYATNALAAGVPLEDVQDSMGHADPRTTQRYNRRRHALDNDPALRLAAERAKRRG